MQRHAKKYPLMEPTDAVKLIYQNVFGGGHLIKDPAACRCALQHEYESLRQDPYAPLLETIGNGMVRVMLNAMDLIKWVVWMPREQKPILLNQYPRAKERAKERGRGKPRKLRMTPTSLYGM